MLAPIREFQTPFVNEQDCVWSGNRLGATQKKLKAVRYPQHSGKHLLKKTKSVCLPVVSSQSPLLQHTCLIHYVQNTNEQSQVHVRGRDVFKNVGIPDGLQGLNIIHVDRRVNNNK